MNRPFRFKSRRVLAIILFLLSLVLALFLKSWLFSEEPLIIAVSVGIDQPIDIGVDQAIKGVEEYIAEVNQKGGINGKKLKLELFNDGNNPEQAREVAEEIAQESNALVVLGHYYSSSSIAAGEVYQEFGVPAITGGATADEVTKGNNWYFRTLVNGSSQMDFLAFYLQEVLGYSQVSLVYDAEEDYSNSVKQAFIQGAAEHQVTIQNQWNIAAANNTELKQNIENLVAELADAKPEEVGAIVVLVIEDPAEQIITAIKRQGLSYPIIGGDTLSSGTFVQRFANYPEEQAQPGYFTNGIYSISQIIFDVLGERAQKFKNRYLKKYNQEPGWVAATFYNSAKVAIAALERAEVTGNPNLLAQERRKVRNQITLMNSLETSVPGINGAIYFDAEGDSAQNVAISVTVNNQLVSALEQLTPLAVTKSQEETATDLTEGTIVQFGEQFLNRTNVVYTGVRPRHISNLDLEQKTFQLDFDLWFRYRTPENTQNTIPIADIQFLNAVGEIDLGKPTTKVVKNNVAYDLYQVSGTFNLNFLESDRNFGEHILGINFINQQIGQNHLLYVIDSLGLGPNADQSLVELLQNDQVLSSDTGWQIERATFFQDSTEQETLGNPIVLTNQGIDAQFSRFNLAIVISQEQLNFRRKIGRSSAIYLWILAAVIIYFLSFKKNSQRIKLSELQIWGLKLVSSLILLFATEIILVKSLEKLIIREYTEFIILIFDTLWWIVPAYFFGEALELFFWKPLEQKTGQAVPTLVHRMVLMVVYLLTFFCVIAYVFNQPLTSLLATSGLALTIIGLAIQINISNIFSGLAINLERTFQVGDYIEILDEGVKGYVADITWRATHIETLSGNTILIPNSVINDKTVINYMRPQTITRATIPFTLTQDTPPEMAIEAFEQALSTAIAQNSQSLLAEPTPEVLCAGTDSLGIIYELNFWYIPTNTNFEQIQNLVVQTALKYLRKENIELACGEED
ncbi:ABC-type branched-chain amino acid transport system, periplasmic component [Xenococcus sp. PCC 7305]|uniref:ABC transporter substrate-binding protein n=1 Tax=Xenococcus sp. PCC 7305 TaxID=102125 RepID=UPI0002AC7171|nr:ABC transporter substrate-binding protein [Xenococcus sp. PCC 7305]ELS02642.1 ABC-type branched-chain amino acid transport system, periplasmic component [Xenococcus sp. PCC 7305]